MSDEKPPPAVSDPGIPLPPVSVSKRGTLIAHVGGVTLRIKRRTQTALAPLAIKLLVAGAGVAAGAIAAWRC